MARSAERKRTQALPPAVGAAGALLAQSTAAQGWLDPDGRLR